MDGNFLISVIKCSVYTNGFFAITSSINMIMLYFYFFSLLISHDFDIAMTGHSSRYCL